MNTVCRKKIQRAGDMIKTTITQARTENKISKEKWRDKRKRSCWLFVALTWLTQFTIQLLVMYSVCVAVALGVIPALTKNVLAAGLANGIDMAKNINLIGFWGFPVIFIILCVFFAYAWLMIALWKGLNKRFNGWRVSRRDSVATKLDADKNNV